MKQALAVWGDFFSEFEKDKKLEDVSMLAVKDENVTFDLFFLLLQTQKMKKKIR